MVLTVNETFKLEQEPDDDPSNLVPRQHSHYADSLLSIAFLSSQALSTFLCLCFRSHFPGKQLLMYVALHFNGAGYSIISHFIGTTQLLNNGCNCDGSNASGIVRLLDIDLHVRC